MGQTEIFELRNSFHNTAVRVRLPTSLMDAARSDAYDMGYTLQEAVWRRMDPEWHARDREAWVRRERRVRRALCGMADCHCGTVRA